MHQSSDALSHHNIDQTLAEYVASIEQLGESVAGFRGIRLLEALKRDIVGIGPYPKVTLFEAANRIMTDLVILCGVRWLLKHAVFPFDTYTVEYGNDDKKGFDLTARANGLMLIGEAFNVAPSFFQMKKSAMLKKLRNSSVTADFKVVMFNSDAVLPTYVPDPQINEFFVIVSVGTEEARVVSNGTLKTDARHAGAR